jgi:hypothetical protein
MVAMKRRRFIILIIVLLFAGAIWWWQSPGPAPEKVATAPVASATPNTTVAPKPIPAALQVAAPTVAPAATPAPKPAEPTPTPAEPEAGTEDQKEINTMLSSAVDQIQNGNLVDMFENFVPPDQLAEMKRNGITALEEALQNKQGQPEIQIWIQVLQAMKEETPTYNDAGDQATYAISDPTGRGITLRPIVLHKVNGQWYFTATDILIGGAGFGLAQNPPILGL